MALVIELRTLGGLDLRGCSDAIVASLLGQTRPTALLIYLAIAQPDSFHRRDHLVTLFWAETDQEHARSNLRKLVFTLRRHLGDDLLETRGDEELRISPQALWCDAAEFLAAASIGRSERVIELYRGVLLPGFHISGAKGFEGWLEQTRRHYSRLAVRVALALAETHASAAERTRAGDLAHFITQREPELDDEHQLRKLLSLLDRLGDRRGAMRMYESFRQRLWNDFRVSPAAETRKLVEAMRTC
jgi:DNA-binding SARP family transcriptional activator